MPANRMNRDEFYTAMAPHDDAHLRKVLWTLYWRYWRGNAQLRERIEDELRPQELPKVKAKNEPPDPDTLRILHWARAKPALVLLYGGPGVDYSLFKPEFSAILKPDRLNLRTNA